MKLLLALCVVVLVALSSVQAKECIYIEGRCYAECEAGTHSYTTGCGPLTPEPTCDQPNPVTDRSNDICDYSACYCNEPTVRDSVSGKCVKLEECPKTPKKE